jgi:hypothetical protein
MKVYGDGGGGEHVSHPHKITNHIMYFCIFLFLRLQMTNEKTKDYQFHCTLIEFNLLLISSWTQFWFLTDVTKYFNYDVLKPVCRHAIIQRRSNF